MSKRPTLGEILKEARAQTRETLREVEQKTKISNAYLSQLESGTVTEPSPHKLHALSKHYDVDYSLLMEAAGYVVPAKDKTFQTNNVQALLRTQKPLTDDESNALAAYLIQYRQFSDNKPSHKSKRDLK